jgi:hypothetical protein
MAMDELDSYTEKLERCSTVLDHFNTLLELTG